MFLLPWQARLLIKSRFVNNEFWEYGSVSIYATEVLALITILLFAVFISLTGQWHKILRSVKKFKRLKNFKKINLVLIGILLLVWLVISNFWAGDQLIAWTRLLHIILVGFMIFVVSYMSIPWQKLAVIFIGIGVLQGYIAIDQFLTQAVVGSSWLGMSEQLPMTYGVSVIQHESARWLRAYGTLPHPNILGSVMSISLLFLVFLMIKVRKGDIVITRFNPRLFMIAWYGSLFFIFSGLLLSFSRAAWLASIIGMGVFFYLIYKHHRSLLAFFIKINLVLAFIILFWFMVSPLPFITRLQGQQPLEKQSYEERIKSYTDSEDVTRKYWGQGSGLGNYTSVLIDQNPNRKMSLQQPIHNAWLLVFNEIGIIGFGLFVAFFYFVYKESRVKSIAVLFLLPVAILMLFDHFWVSLVFGNVWLLFLFYFVRKLEFK